AHWAYNVLGWGGYWGWDPVENASLMPWLTGTAFLHSVMMQEKRGMMKSWNVWLIFSTFMLTILGTLLTRSGIISSVHAFASSDIGNWFYGFILIVFAVCLLTFFKQRDHLKSENKLESIVSRESSFLFNNLILLAACFTILWGTLFPILSEYVQGSKVTVGAPFYNRVNIPIGLFLIFLTGIGPLLAWRSTSLRSIRRNFILPTAAFFIMLIVLLVFVDQPWKDGDGMESTIFSLMAFSLAAGVITAIVAEFLRGANVVRTQTRKNLFASTLLLIRRNTRRYGGYIVHFGIVVMFIGIAGGAFNQSHEQEMGFGDTLQLGPFRLVCQSYTQDSNANFDTEYALLDVYKGSSSKKITQLTPELRFYHASQTQATMVANRSTLASDLYVIYEGKNPDTDKPIIKAFINPLMAWIWIGVVIIVIGTFVALVPNLAKSPSNTAPARVVLDEPELEPEVHHA
ncbi:MAG: cytochrome c-type biogenesis CcmF C-terminal domain-containing protein, partial [Granulicella sp.]